MRKSIVKYYFPLCFLLLICLPFLNSTFSFVKNKRVFENRKFNDSLSFNVNKLDAFPSDFEAYYNDNFSFRTPLLNFFHKIKYNIYKVSPDDEKLVVGKDGWCFLGEPDQKIYDGRKNFSEHELDLFTALWKERLAYLESKNIKTYWLICPTKFEVYKDKLPYNVLLNKDDSRTKKLIKHLHRNLRNFIYDPSNYLINQRKNYKLYYQLDNHWNQRAGNLISQFILSEMEKDFPLLDSDYLSNYHWKDTIRRDGIHYATIGIKELFETNEIITEKKLNTVPAKRYSFPIPEGFPYPWDYQYRFENKKTGNYRILVIHDSFGDAVMPFLKEAFSESVFIFDAWQYGLDKNIIEKVNPDIILYLSLETNLENFIN